VSQTAPPSPAHRHLVPRDSATLVIVDRSLREPRMLMGRRRADLAFLPNKFVFPGGRVDPTDGSAPSADDLAHQQIESLLIGMRGRPSHRRARALAMAALRETLEETGLAIGTPPAAGQPFLPRLGTVHYFARAITPPGRPRRYDTRFFMVDAKAIAAQGLTSDGELSGLDWFTVDGMRALDLAGITRRIVEDVAAAIECANLDPGGPIPFYFQRRGVTCREQLSRVAPPVA
jgi:8-oxo-dGTP pyrophosphatase MutT (NUDIX family)